MKPQTKEKTSFWDIAYILAVIVLCSIGLATIVESVWTRINAHFDRIDQLEKQVSDLQNTVDCKLGTGMCWEVLYTPPPISEQMIPYIIIIPRDTYLLKGDGYIVFGGGKKLSCDGGDFTVDGGSDPFWVIDRMVGTCIFNKI